MVCMLQLFCIRCYTQPNVLVACPASRTRRSRNYSIELRRSCKESSIQPKFRRDKLHAQVFPSSLFSFRATYKLRWEDWKGGPFMFLGERVVEVVLMRRFALSSSSSPLRCTNGRLKPIPAPLSLDLMRRDKRDEWQSCSITYVHQKNDEMHPESDVEMTSADSTFPCLGRCPASACSSGIDLWYLPKKELAKVKLATCQIQNVNRKKRIRTLHLLCQRFSLSSSHSVCSWLSIS